RISVSSSFFYIRTFATASFLYKNGDSNISFLSLIFKSRDKPKGVDRILRGQFISPASFLFVHLS
ncbi:hypothetical protein, partial [Anaerococcus nagyae]|uniref:hypothetical protein n=1 Tax=Anaerococcus nagyae TaxID=1755241 RepID=UPI001C705A00